MKAALPSEISHNNYKPRVETFIELTNKYSDEDLNLFLINLQKHPGNRMYFQLISGYQVIRQAVRLSR